MTAEQWGTLLVYVVAPSATLFPILYGLTAPWYRTFIGYAVMTAKVGLALLVDASLLFHLFGPTYPHRDVVVLGAFGVIGLGSYLYLAAFIREQYLKRRDRLAQQNAKG